jgi:uracil-DNA glycosylase
LNQVFSCCDFAALCVPLCPLWYNNSLILASNGLALPGINRIDGEFEILATLEGLCGELALTDIAPFPQNFPAGWRAVAEAEFSKAYFRKLQAFVDTERRKRRVFPAAENVYRAFELTPFQDVRVVILGQDPYHDDGQAHGLSFSVRPGVKSPPSLRNIFKELHADLGTAPANHGCLEAWARQGVLLLNTVLTVRSHEAHSHRGKGWEEFTSRIVQAINRHPHVAFVLWGKPAQEIAGTLDERHLVIESPHPSPLSAYRGFFGSRPFSRINSFLKQTGQPEIHWELPAESNIAAPLDNNWSATSTPI